MFDFHNYLNGSENDSTIRKWALTLAIFDRLSFHGLPVEMHVNRDRLSDPPLVVSLGSMQVSYRGSENIDDIEDWAFLSRSFANKACENLRLPHLDLDNAVIIATEDVNQAINKSIENWIKYGDINQPGTSLEAKIYSLKKLGFNTEKMLYHETESEFESKITSDGFDLSFIRGRRSELTLPDGVYFKPTKKPLDLASNPVQMPFLIKASTPLIITDRESMSSSKVFSSNVEEMKVKYEQGNDYHDGITKEILELVIKTPLNDELESRMRLAMESWREFIDDSAAAIRKEITNGLKSQGVRVLTVLNDKGSLGRSIESTISLYPEDIISPLLNSVPTPKIEDLKFDRDKLLKNEFTGEEPVVEADSPALLNRRR